MKKVTAGFIDIHVWLVKRFHKFRVCVNTFVNLFRYAKTERLYETEFQIDLNFNQSADAQFSERFETPIQNCQR
jgi:hypothetical protein